jgi:protein-S-isoprenylcysteine O-methyltransferase Ste14
MVIHIQSDELLRNLRNTSGSGYKIPRGTLFKYVSCPNYLGEIIEWFGWALLTWSWAGLAFALFTVANLAPRALANHRWYQKQFPSYPPDRKALAPFLF